MSKVELGCQGWQSAKMLRTNWGVQRLKKDGPLTGAVSHVLVGPNRPAWTAPRISPARHSGTLALWHPWHSGTLAPWHPGTLAPWHPGTLAPLALWPGPLIAS